MAGLTRESLKHGEDTPLYLRVRQLLRDEIAKGAWKPGEMLPTETELGRQLGVSPGTVRQAVLSLVREGLITRRPGKGTFVARMDNSRSFARFFRFREGGTGERFDRKITVDSVAVTTDIPRAVTQHLGVRAGSRVLKVRRVVHMADRPVCIYTSYLPYRLVQGLEKRDLSAERLYQIIEEHCGVHVLRAEELLRATAATEADARLLNLPVGSPVILIERTAFTHNDTVIEWRQTIGRSDDFTYKIRMP
ncbi:GntR family transcriptional regulator [Acuticoccus kandeliae]|uniref:GntR family transcriptional regulator n=1 Tax=Acuticoccus kandeliae TaxID=2073160 RepID=UPI000D3E6EAD|nr:GntR family transcriptional regulator [Acuticoccus kandeliae]